MIIYPHQIASPTLDSAPSASRLVLRAARLAPRRRDVGKCDVGDSPGAGGVYSPGVHIVLVT